GAYPRPGGQHFSHYDDTAWTSLRWQDFEPEINRSVSGDGPASGRLYPGRQKNNSYSVTAHGWIHLPTSGDYTFYSTKRSGDLIDTYVDGVLVLNNTCSVAGSGNCERSATVTLTAGWHRLAHLHRHTAFTNYTFQARYAGPGIA